MRSTRPFALAALVAVVAGTACASESGDSTTAGPGDRSVSGYLAALPAPADDEGLMVTYGDVARAAEIGEVEIPDDVADEDALADFLMDVTGTRVDGAENPVAVLMPEVAQTQRLMSDPRAFVDELGWSIVDVESFAELSQPPRPVSILDGTFDGEAIEGVLDEAEDGVLVAGDPDVGMDFEDTTVARPLGQPLWLAVDGGRLVVTADEADMAAARAGDDTLADHAALGALAEALDRHEVYSAMLDGTPSAGVDVASRVLGERATPELLESLEDLPRCPGVTGVATGVADDGEPLIVLAMAHADDDAAEANVDVLADVLENGDELATRRPWTELLTVESVEAEGPVVVATARPAGDAPLAIWYRLVLERSFPPC